MAAGSLTLGGNMSIAVGPIGRNGEASGSLNTSGSVAAMLEPFTVFGHFEI
jgi:lipid-binding SYLF domain-containing protein